MMPWLAGGATAFAILGGLLWLQTHRLDAARDARARIGTQLEVCADTNADNQAQFDALAERHAELVRARQSERERWQAALDAARQGSDEIAAELTRARTALENAYDSDPDCDTWRRSPVCAAVAERLRQ